MAKFAKFVDARCTPSLLMALAMGKVESCPLDETEIAEPKGSVVAGLASDGFELKRPRRCPDRLPFLGDAPQGVRVGPGSRMPRLPALYWPKKKWRLASQLDPRAYL